MAVKMYTVSSQQAVEYKLHCLLVVKCSSDKRLGNAQSNQQPLVVKVKVGRPPGKLGVIPSQWNVMLFPSVLCHCWLGDKKRVWPVKKLGVGLFVVKMSLELSTPYCSSCFVFFKEMSSIQITDNQCE